MYLPAFLRKKEPSGQLMSQSIPTGYWVHLPGQPPGLAQKKLPGGRDLTFESCPGTRNSTRAGILSETFCPYIGFISDKYRVSQNC